MRCRRWRRRRLCRRWRRPPRPPRAPARGSRSRPPRTRARRGRTREPPARAPPARAPRIPGERRGRPPVAPSRRRSRVPRRRRAPSYPSASSWHPSVVSVPVTTMTSRRRLGLGPIVLALLLVALVVGGVVVANGTPPKSDAARPAAAVAGAVDTIARRVETLRGLKFKSIPKPAIETPEQTREAVTGNLDKDYPAKRREADQDLLELFGLVPAGTDLAAVTGDISGQQIAGYYDPKRKRLVVVDGEAAANAVLAEITLAHELTHALEDQNFGVKEP